MLQHVNTVIVGKTAAVPNAGTSGVTAVYAGTYDTVTEFLVGEVFLVDEKMELIGTNAKAVAAKEVRFALKTDKTTTYTDTTGADQTATVIKYSEPIQKGAIKNAKYNVYVAPVEEKITFDFTGVVPVVGNRYVVRFIYNDIYEHPGQFTKTYEVIATTAILADLVAALKNRINKDMGRRITISSNSNYATDFIATAKAKNDNEGKESINTYTQVSMEAVVYYTNPDATGWNSKIKRPVDSLTISKVVAPCPRGYWKQVRDMEQTALAYKGVAYRNVWPYSNMKPELLVEVDGTYDSLVVEFENKFLTPDNQKNANTMQSAQVFITGTLAGSVLAAHFDAFNA
jgi:hypothetical protein